VYLDKLEFDNNLNKSWFTFFIDRTRFTWLVIFLIFISWILWLRSLSIESSPEVKIWIALVSTTLLWASPESMEDLVTKKIEKNISKIKWIDTITSVSMNSVSLLSIQFKSDADIDSSMRDLKDSVDLSKTELPLDAKDSIVREVSFDDTPIWTFSISWKYDSSKLYEYAKIIRDELEKNSIVSEVEISWWQELEYSVFIDPKKLELYWLSLDNVNNSIKSSNFTLAVWDINIWNYNHSIWVDTRYYDLEKLKNVVVSKLGETWVIYLKDLAKVEESPKKITSISRLSIKWWDSLNAVNLGVVKKRWGSILNLVSSWEENLKKLKDSWLIPKDLNITTILDQSERIKLDLSHLIRDGIITILLVFITLFIFIWIKEALVAWAAVPLVFLITFLIMSIAGQTLNFLSMFTLILSLWLLVDDAIVVISAINQYKKTWKFTTREAALLVLKDYKKVLITTTLTVVWIFSAMLFMTWIIWKFIFSIPFVITITLLSSLLIALTINPALAVIIWWRNNKNIIDDESDLEHKLTNKSFKSFFKKVLNNGIISLSYLEIKYWKLIKYLLWSKSRVYIFLFFTFLIFLSSLSLPFFWILKSDFFPKTDQDSIFINIEAEPWTNLETTSWYASIIEKFLLDEKEINSFSTQIWSLASVWRNMGWSTVSDNYANITVNLVKKEYGRSESSLDISDRIRKKFSNIKNFKINVLEVSWWPPSWSDFELKITWEDFVVLDKIALDVKKILAWIDWVINIDSTRKLLPFELNLYFDTSKLSLYDISVAQVSLFLKNSIDWVEATKIYKWTDEIIVRTQFDKDYVDTIEKIKYLTITNNRGVVVSLKDLFKQDFKTSVFSITRVNQKRIVSVTAQAKKWHTWKEILSTFNEKMKDYKLDTWYEFSTWWVNEENQKSVTSLLIALAFWMIFIVTTLVLLYDSYTQSILVMLTIPLSLIWVFYWLTLSWQVLSFPWLIGLVALFWIVVRNWIILFDKINLNLKEWIIFKDSIIDAWISRLEPVFLTSVCTILWMIPLTLSNPTWTSLWLSIIFWLSVSTLFTLLVLPSVFYIFLKRKNTRIK